MRRLIDEVPWRSESIAIWGKTYPQPRLIAWYGDAGTRYTYSGLCLHPLPWTPVLLDLKCRVEVAAATGFNNLSSG